MNYVVRPGDPEEATADLELARQNGTATVFPGGTFVGQIATLQDILAGPHVEQRLKEFTEALAGQELEDGAGDMVSVVKEESGIANTLFVSTKGNSRHAARLKIAIDPPNSLNEACKTTSVAFHDFSTVGEYAPSWMLEQVKEFIELNRAVLLDYWNAKISTAAMFKRLKPILPKGK